MRSRLRRALSGEARPLTVAVVGTAVFEAAIGALAGFGGPGYETALLSGLFLPGLAAVSAAQYVARNEKAPFESVARAAWLAAAMVVTALIVSLLHGLRAGLCDPWGGLTVMVLGPSVGIVMGALWGALAAEASRFIANERRRRRLRVVLAVGLPVGSALGGLLRFYASPMIFAYDPFVGYFSGTLYDTVLEYGTLATYRLGSLATVLALLALTLHLTRDTCGRARPTWIGRPGLAALGVSLALVSVVHTLRGPALGYLATRETIAEELGGKLVGERCDVIFARTIKEDDVRLFLSECEAHVVVNEAWWGARGPEKITAFLFTDEDQKGRLMGAAGTNIAKPWRAEVYVQDSAFPHRVLGHELMHVIAGSDGPGPFKVAGRLGGLLPNPGLIEGVAVAASPKDDDLLPMEWAKSMKDLGILPPLDRLLGLAFFSENSAMAYTVSGAFVGWFHDRFGADALRAWYRGEPLKRLTGFELSELEQQWHADLDALTLPEAAQIQAKAKFDKPGFFARRCPRLVDACRDRAESLSRAGDVEGALSELAVARRYEPDNPSLRLDEATARSERDPAEADQILRALADDAVAPRFARDKALEELADRALATADVKSARAIYQSLLARTLDESKLRTLNVKLASTQDEELRPALVLLLVGKPGRKPDRAAASALLGVLDRERRDDGLPAYLLARPSLEAGDYTEAALLLDRALARRIDVPRVRAEALRLRIVAAAALGDVADAEQRLSEYKALPDVRAARIDAAERLVARTKLGVVRAPKADETR